MVKNFNLVVFVNILVFILGCRSALRAEDSIQVRSDNFTLSGQIDGAQGVDMISELERFRSALLEIHNLPASTKDNRVDIYIVSDSEIFDILGVNENFVAIYAPTPAGPRALINGSEGVLDASAGSDLRSSLRHEYAHHFTRTYLSLTEPVWLSEGLAEFYAGYAENEDGSYQIGTAHDGHVEVLSYPIHGWSDMRDVLSSFRKIKHARYPSHTSPADWSRRPDNVTFFYAQSWGLIHWALNRSGTTEIESGSKMLNSLVDRLLINDMPVTRDLSHWPDLQAMRIDTPTKDDAIVQSVAAEFNLPLLKGVKEEPESKSLERMISDYIAAGVPSITRRPHPDRVTASVSVKTLTPANAAAVQYRQLSLTAGSRALINPRMKSLKAEVEASPEAASSLILSEAAQQYATGGTQSAVNHVAEAKRLNLITPEDEALLLQIAFGDFTNRYFQNPEAMRRKLRPALSQTPDDINLLVMMAMTGLGDIRDAGAEFAPEAQTALQRLEQRNVAKHRPLMTMPLINLYATQEDDKSALFLLYRAMAFQPSNQFELRRAAEQLEERLNGPNPQKTQHPY